MKEIEIYCAHNYEYSHRETTAHEFDELVGPRLVDVVICTKCGNVKRN